MASQAVTAKGQVTLKRDLLQHLGIKPGERIDFEKLPWRGWHDRIRCWILARSDCLLSNRRFAAKKGGNRSREKRRFPW